MDTQLQVHLTHDEGSKLEQMLGSGTHSARTLTRARMLLLADRSQGEKRTDLFIADALQCNRTTVRSIRRRYVEGGLALALYDKGWPGAPPKFSGEDVAHLTMLACSTPPAGHARWTLRLLADQMIELGYVEYISHVTVRELLKKTHSSRGR
jgi:transposase